MSARSKARKRALDLIFEADARGVPVGRLLAERVGGAPGLTPGDAELGEFAQTLVRGVSQEQERIDELLSTYSQGWTLDRMPAVDRAILRLATWELLYSDEVPDAVVIDEAVTLAGSLSTDESPAFVNGLLGRLAELKPA